MPRVLVPEEILSIEDYQLDSLGLMLQTPHAFTQRLVETLSFHEDGGQQWQREIQIRMPELELPAAAQEDERLFIVPLGMFKRRRFPDIKVSDGKGARQILLTRRQHCHVLTYALLRQFLSSREDWEAIEGDSDLLDSWWRLYHHLGLMLMTIPEYQTEKEDDLWEDANGRAQRLLRELLVGLGRSQEQEACAALLDKTTSAIPVQTQYLCWVRAVPGSVISLTACYSAADIPVLHGTLEKGSENGNPSDLSSVRLWWRNRRMVYYQQSSLLPIHYGIYTPAHDHAGSFYFSLDPPLDSETLLLTWNDQCRFKSQPETERREVDNRLLSCHVHNGARPATSSAAEGRPRETIEGSYINAFIRARPSANTRLVALACLSLVLAWLAQHGAFVTRAGTSAGQLLFLAPAAIAAYIAQQQRHHFGPITRPFRLAMWIYIALATLFAISAVYDIVDVDNSWGHEDLVTDLVSGGLFVTSIAMISLFFLSGGHFARSTERRYRRVADRVGAFGTASWLERVRRFPLGWKPPVPIPPAPGVQHSSSTIYSAVARHSIDRALVGTATLCVLAVTVMVVTDWGTGRIDRERAQASLSQTSPQPSAARMAPAAQP